MTDNVNKSKDKKHNSSRGGKTGAGTGRPSSAASNSTGGGAPTSKNTQSNTPDSGSEQKRSDSISRQSSNRGRGHGGGRGAHRKASSTSQNGPRNGNGSAIPKSSQAAGAPATGPPEGSDALQSLQRVITDLKSISPPSNAAPLSGNIPPNTNLANSNLPINAPVFQPGAAAFPSLAGRTSPGHRKAASMGASPSAVPHSHPSLHQFQSNLSSMAEDMEQSRHYEEGEIPEPMSWQQQQDFPGAVQRANAGGFVAPRFAALAQQQQQQQTQQLNREELGPSGRPQLAPGFTFGARRKPSSAAIPVGPPIDEEEDANFQFPQSMTAQMPEPSPAAPRRPDTGDIGGIVAEQVRNYHVYSVLSDIFCVLFR
jgi:protein SSD1